MNPYVRDNDSILLAYLNAASIVGIKAVHSDFPIVFKLINLTIGPVLLDL
jgi:hypothetical protein